MVRVLGLRTRAAPTSAPAAPLGGGMRAAAPARHPPRRFTRVAGGEQPSPAPSAIFAATNRRPQAPPGRSWATATSALGGSSVQARRVGLAASSLLRAQLQLSRFARRAGASASERASSVARARTLRVVAKAQTSKRRNGRSPMAENAKIQGLVRPLVEERGAGECALGEEEALSADGTYLVGSPSSRLRTLVLDVSFQPVDIMSWQRAICLDILDKVEVVEYYSSTVRSSGAEFRIPAVIKVNVFVSQESPKSKLRAGQHRHNFNRRHIFARDDFQCQYCNATKDLTIDHLIPVSRGGPWTWENLVTACSKCNGKKGSRTPQEAGLRLLKEPVRPKTFRLCLHNHDLRNVPDIWVPYIPAEDLRTPKHSLLKH